MDQSNDRRPGGRRHRPRSHARRRARAASHRAALRPRVRVRREHLIGGAAIDATAIRCRRRRWPRAARPTRCCSAPSADRSGPIRMRRCGPSRACCALRKELGLFANLRPVTLHPGAARRLAAQARSARRRRLMFVRELTGGIYFGEKTRTDDFASDLCTYTVAEIERVTRVAGRLAQAAPQAHRLRRQGQRARDLAAVARDGRARDRARSSPTSSSSTCWSTRPRCT